MVVGKDILVTEVLQYAGKTLVGRFTDKSPGDQALHAWMEEHWLSLLGYISSAHTLVQGWIAFFLQEESHCNLLLDKAWNWGPSGL
jgi:hypothetical protein